MATTPAAERASGPNLLAEPRTVDARVPGVEFSWQQFERIVAAGIMVACGTRIFLFWGVTIGYVVAAGLLPVWIGSLRRYRGGPLFVIVGAMAALWGLLLSVWVDSAHHVDHKVAIASMATLVGAICSIGAVLWARRVLGMRFVGAFFGLGMLLSAAMKGGAGADNPWKFVIAIPLAVFLLSLLHLSSSRVPELLGLLLFAVVSAALDSRSYFGAFLLAALLVAWQLRSQTASRRASWVWRASLIGGIVVAIYNLGTALLLNGALGAEAQQRSISQIDTAGSLILGGRPELAATFALMRSHPMGYGVGVAPNHADMIVAKTGMAEINYDPNNGYVERYMLGGHFELHSIIGDLWSGWGIMGLILVGVIAALLIRSLAEGIGGRMISGVTAFLACWSLWNLLFSPLYSAAPSLIIGIGLTLLPVRQHMDYRRLNSTTSSSVARQVDDR